MSMTNGHAVIQIHQEQLKTRNSFKGMHQF